MCHPHPYVPARAKDAQRSSRTAYAQPTHKRVRQPAAPPSNAATMQPGTACASIASLAMAGAASTADGNRTASVLPGSTTYRHHREPSSCASLRTGTMRMSAISTATTSRTSPTARTCGSTRTTSEPAVRPATPRRRRVSRSINRGRAGQISTALSQRPAGYVRVKTRKFLSKSGRQSYG